MYNDVLPVLIIPAYNPDTALLELLQAHRENNNKQRCLIVNDGSHADSIPIFTALEQQGYEVLHHLKNQGKGAALKTAMNHFLLHYAESSPGVITADADGQHTIKDIERLSQCFIEAPQQLHLGVRQINHKGVPFRSRIGNVLTKSLFNLVTKNKVEDTQTGLRGIPTELLRYMVESSSSGYEFEFEMFFIAKQHQIQIKQIPIETIYIDHNKSSHFDPLWDSLRIYFIFIRFCSVAMASFLLDFTVFTLFYQFSGQAALAVFIARSISAPFNFILNKKISFKSKNKLLLAAMKYFALVFMMAFLSLHLMNLLHDAGLNMYSSKIMAEFFIFLLNFFIQYLFIFSKRAKEKRVDYL
jgi:putative flippase GtrA